MIQCRNCNEKINDILNHRHICLKPNKVKWSVVKNGNSKPPLLVSITTAFRTPEKHIEETERHKQIIKLVNGGSKRKRWCKKCNELFEIDGYHKYICHECRVHKPYYGLLVINSK